MTFLHWTLLGGIGLIGVPIVLHLIMRQQPRHLEFPALRFIKQREDANRRRLKLRHWLLLALRCGVISLLALALARPSIQASGVLGDQEAPVAAALVFDTSPRMQYRQDNRTRLELARETGLWLLGQLPDDSEVAVFDSRSSGTRFAADLGEPKRRIERLQASAATQPLLSLCDDAVRLVAESDKARKEIYIFTDLAKSSWSTTSAQLQQRLAALGDIGVYLIDVGVTDPRNFGLAELRLSNQVLAKNSALRIEAELLHTGPAGERSVELYELDTKAGHGQPGLKRSEDSFKLAAGESQHISFRLGNLSPGVHQGYLKIAGEDALADDDVRYFSVDVRPAWQVLLAAPSKPEDYALFLREALAPYAMRMKKEAAFECRVVSLDDLAKLPLDGYAAVCLIDPTPLADNVWQRLGAYVAEGGGLALFLGRNAKAADFNKPAAQELLPAALLRQSAQEVFLSPDNLHHPLLAKFRSVESAVPWDAFPIFKHWELGSLQKGAGVVIAYSNTHPALVEKPLGKGRVLALTTPVSDAATRRDLWNTLPTGDEPWPFVMLSNELLLYMVGSGETRLNYLAGETAVLHLQSNEHRAIFSLVTPRGDQIRQSADEKQNALVVTSTDEPGNYTAEAGGEIQGVRLGFSINLPANISQLERATEEDLRAVFGSSTFRLAHSREEIDRSLSMGRIGQELYPWLILAVAAFLAGEHVLANRFYRHESARKQAALRATANAVEDTKRDGATVGAS